jgi:OFA family oxalate/formate antiporter-like MFS transporter
MTAETTRNLGWRVTLAGTGINLALGVLYAWSIISGEIEGWNQTMKSIPYSIACGVFALTMVPAGRLQDRLGPRLTASIGGLLTGLGFILCSVWGSFTGFIVGFGILAGIGIGFGYASATPPALKWFPASRTGLIAGVVVSGFGLASAYIGPLARWLVASFGLNTSMLIMGVAFLIIVILLAQLLVNPPPGYVPAAPAASRAATPSAAGAVQAVNMSTGAMIRDSRFWILWVMYACGAGAGLMVIGKLKPIVQDAAGDLTWFAPLCLSVLAVGNAAGRIIAGIISDRLGRSTTMFLIFVLQAAVMVGLIFYGTLAPIAIALSFLAGFNYGANLSVFPSATKDLFGLKNFGLNYGAMFTAWGFGGVVLPIVAGKVADVTGSFNLAYIIAAACLVVASALSFIVRKKNAPTGATA